MLHKQKNIKKILIKAAMIAVWVLIWQIAALILNNPLLLASPMQSIKALFTLIPTSAFWKALWGSFYKIASGFLLASVVGVLLAVLSYKVKYMREFLSPPMSVCKSVPVASFTILLLISLKTRQNLSLVVCFIMVLPVIYANTLAGLDSVEHKMLQMAKVFQVGRKKKFTYIYLYKVLPHFSTGAKISLGLSWKSGVAAELIGLIGSTIGGELYSAKLFLLMDSVFAWTFVIIILSMTFEGLVMGLLKLLKSKIEGGQNDRNKKSE